MKPLILAGLVCVGITILAAPAKADLSEWAEEDIYKQACNAYQSGKMRYIPAFDWINKQVEKNYEHSPRQLDSIDNDPEFRKFFQKQEDIFYAYMYQKISNSIMSRVYDNCKPLPKLTIKINP
jgi:hypothetical protein